MFHYTSMEGHIGILETRQIWPSLKANNPKDARYGEGQYVSDIVPGSRRPGQPEVIYGRPNVFLIKNASPLDVSDRLVSQGVN